MNNRNTMIQYNRLLDEIKLVGRYQVTINNPVGITKKANELASKYLCRY